MSILFKKPERKLDSFLVPLRDKKNNKIRLRITDDITLQKILKVKDQNAYVIQYLVRDRELHDIIRQYDRDVLAHVLEHCNSWFQTDLSEEKIHEMFLPSFDEESVMKALVSSIIEPIVVLDNNLYNSFSDIVPIMESKKSLSNVRTLLEIEAQGIYIRSRKFGIRWLVKSVRMFQDDIQPVEDLFDLSTCDDIVASYKDDILELEQQVGFEINELTKKMQSLQDYMRRVKHLMDDVEYTKQTIDQGPEFVKEWGTKTDALHRLIWKYQRDRLVEKQILSN